jgi:membrane-bound lytic murein transglycosylase F
MKIAMPWFCLCFLLLVSCSKNNSFFKLKPAHETGKLKVLTLYSTTSYYQGDKGEDSGFEYELVNMFAKDQGLELELIVVDTIDELIKDLKSGRAHLGAAGLTITKERQKGLSFSSPYQSVKQQVVCGEKHYVKKLKDLSKLKLVVNTGTSYEETLKKVKEEHPEINYKSLKDSSSQGVLEQIWNNRKLCTLVDSNILAVHRRYFPELRVVYEFKDQSELAWAFPPKSEKLINKVNEWLEDKRKVTLKNLKNKYYGHLKDFDYYDTKKFLERIETRLPQYKEYFKEASKNSGLPWLFLAAVSYQESQWDKKAVSPTGVRGLMMLTQNTAKEVGVKKRTDPEQSIKGGARYLRRQLERLPQYIRWEDRKWFALASYNLGFYHLRDGMALTVLQNKDPGSWAHLKEVLPLLSKRKYYKNLRYGYARGLEPVIYVTRIRNYYELLQSNIKVTSK